MRKQKVDEIDYRIIRILSKSGRERVTKIAEQIGLSPPSTIKRIKKLEDMGVIKGYKAEIDWSKLGLGKTFLLLVRAPPQKRDKVAELLKENGVVLYHLMGTYDFAAIIRSSDEKEVLEKLKKMPDNTVVEVQALLQEEDTLF